MLGVRMLAMLRRMSDPDVIMCQGDVMTSTDGITFDESSKVANLVLVPPPQHNVYPSRPFICCVWIKEYMLHSLYM